MKQILATLIFLALFPIATLSQVSTNKVNQKQQTPGQIPAIEQINEPIRLIHSSTQSIPNANHLVSIRFAIELNTAKPIRAFRVHFEQEFEDREIHSAPIVVKSEITIDQSSTNQKTVTFSCKRVAKAKVWVSVVEFEDGTIWKAEMAKMTDSQGRLE